jgi:DNA polymerase-3 subunit alpha
MGVFVRKSKEMGIEVLPPDILDSGRSFKVHDGKIRFGLLGVKNVGTGAADSIIAKREAAEAAGRPWRRLADTLNDVDLSSVNKRATEHLIKCGAFDCFEPNRAKYAAISDIVIDRVKNERGSIEAGQLMLFDDYSIEAMKSTTIDITPPDMNDFTRQEKMLMEKEILGVYLSGHPLDEYAAIIEQISGGDDSYISGKAFSYSYDLIVEDTVIDKGDDYVELKDGMSICFVGIISATHMAFTKRGDMYARALIEDKYGAADLLIWPEPLERSNGAVENDNVVIVRGKVQLRKDSMPTIIVFEVTPIDAIE